MLRGGASAREGVAGGRRAGGGRGRGAGRALRSALPGRGDRALRARGPGRGSRWRHPSRLQRGRPTRCECPQFVTGKKPQERHCFSLIQPRSLPEDRVRALVTRSRAEVRGAVAATWRASPWLQRPHLPGLAAKSAPSPDRMKCGCCGRMGRCPKRRQPAAPDPGSATSWRECRG